MQIIYRTEDGTEFNSASQAEKYERMTSKKIVIKRKEEIKLISVSKLKDIFDFGPILSMNFYLKDEDGNIYEDASYEINRIDNSGHLYCSDYEHGLLKWSEDSKSYCRVLYGNSWKVELLGISKVSYF